MGALLSTGVAVQGHSTSISYEGDGDDQICIMTCVCGWSTPVRSFRHAHSVIEVQRHFERHLESLGIESPTSHRRV